MANMTILSGRLVAVPEMFEMDNDKKTVFCYFTLAVRKQGKFKNGHKNSNAVGFIPCKCMGSMATAFQNNVQKGAYVGLEGHIDTWDGTELSASGHPLKLFCVTVESFQILEHRFDKDKFDADKFDGDNNGGDNNGEDRDAESEKTPDFDL